MSRRKHLMALAILVIVFAASFATVIQVHASPPPNQLTVSAAVSPHTDIGVVQASLSSQTQGTISPNTQAMNIAQPPTRGAPATQVTTSTAYSIVFIVVALMISLAAITSRRSTELFTAAGALMHRVPVFKPIAGINDRALGGTI